MSVNDLTPDQLKKLELAEKLFRTAGRSPEEAAQYSARAMAILEDLNLDMSVLEQGGTEKIKRSDEKMKGGLYKWQRDLWRAIAELHFCYYWNQYNWNPYKVSAYDKKRYGAAEAKALGRGGYTFQHRIVGRTVNVVATRNMAGYMEQTIERIVRENLSGEHLFSNYASSLRQGMAEEIILKINKRRSDILWEEQIANREAERKAQEAMAGASTSGALTITSLKKAEEEANYDFLYGEGAFAKRAAERAASAQRWREAEKAHTEWAAANPEEARKQEAERLKSQRRTSWNAGMRTEKGNRDWGAYKKGRKLAEGVGIDPQTSTRSNAGSLS